MSKHNDLVQQTELIHANPAYAKVRYPDGREATVSLEDLAPAPRNTVDKTRFNEVNTNRSPTQVEVSSTFDNTVDNRVLSNEAADNKEEIENHAADEMQFVRPNELDTSLKRSERRNKGVPPMRYGNPLSF